MQAPPLIAAYYTLAGIRPFEGAPGPSPHPLRTRVEAAARSGYSGIGVDWLDLQASIEHHGIPGIRAMLADAGLAFLELEGIDAWYGDGEARRHSDAARQRLFEVAASLALHHVKLTGNVIGRSVGTARMHEEFQRFCAEAARIGLRVSLEMVCISDIADLATACAVLGETPPQNAGLLLDIWHFIKGNQPLAGIAGLPLGIISGVEIDDGAAKPTGSIISEQLDDRRLCGEGDFDIQGFLSAIEATGYAGPIGVEILSAELRALRPDEAATRSFNQARLQFSGGAQNAF